MNNIKQNVELRLGRHIKFKLIFSKQKCSLETLISLCSLGKTNSINLQLSLTSSNINSPINFGVNLTPTFFSQYELLNETSNNECLRITDIYGNFDYFYITEPAKKTYFSYKSQIKLKTNQSSQSYEYQTGENNSIVICPSGVLEFNSFVVTKFKENNKYYLNSNGIFSSENINSSSERVIFNKNSQTNIIESIDIYSTSFSTDSDAKKDRIIFTYNNNKISTIE